jgi:hypothetical protein
MGLQLGYDGCPEFEQEDVRQLKSHQVGSSE